MKNIVNYIFEINILKRELHNGLKMIGVDNPDTVAEHALRAAQIGYILTVLENKKNGTALNPERVASILVFHDNGEARIGDLHKIASRYIDGKKAEKMAFEEQASGLPEEIKNNLVKYFNEIEERTTNEGVIAKDADWLEAAFTVKEYYDLGNSLAMDWIENVEKAVETESAKEILKEMKKIRFTDWWIGLKRMIYKKLDGTEIIRGK